jgi:serine/threonine protein kinase/peptidoglycan hydrolase-like protein with peptidoglycan-binding domain
MSQQDDSQQIQSSAPTVNLVALRRGHVIGRYEIVSILGQGGFGITYLARDAQLGREVAIKEYLPMALAVRHGGTEVLPRSTEVAQDFLWGRERFVSEGRTLASLSDAPAIVRVFDFLEMNGTAYIVMELVPGETLEHLLLRERLDAPGVDRLLWPLLDGLERVHSTGFLHRDIKPANVLLRSDGRPTLIDFGASRAAVAGRTTAMTAIFTPGYAAPEQMSTAKQGPWTDIYGLSATLYHALTGRPPPSAFDRALDDEYETATSFTDTGWPPAILRGIDAGLAVRSADRPQNIVEWRALLKGAPRPQSAAPPRDRNATALSRQAAPAMPAPAGARTQGVPPPPVPSQAEVRPSKGRGGLWAGLAMLALAAAGGGYWLLSQPSGPPVATAPTQADRDRQAAEERKKAEEQEAFRRQVETDTRRQVQAEMTEKQRQEEEARRKADADRLKREQDERNRIVAAETERKRAADAELARKKAEEEQAARLRAEAVAAETALQLAPVDRQRIQVALTSLGLSTGGTDGNFGPRTREMISAWQKRGGNPETGFLNAAQQQALLREAAPAVGRFDEEQKKKEAEERAKATQPTPPSTTPTTAAPATPTPAPAPAPSTALAPPSAVGVDGRWQINYTCSTFKVSVPVTVTGGRGSVSMFGDARSGFTVAVAVTVEGGNATFMRSIVEGGARKTATLTGQASPTQITASGNEAGGVRNCQVAMTRQ